MSYVYVVWTLQLTTLNIKLTTMRMPHWPKPFLLLENETSLQRMQEILAALGNPHLNLPPTVHVAGTNGKGSTIAFLRAMLEAEEKKVHVYTTPHLIEFNERIVLANAEITDNFLHEACEIVRITAEENAIKLGFYEATTAAAFWAFSQVKADYLLLETGMGGRLDATNIIPAPLIAIITTISKDHTKFLGETIEEIAAEKVGIIKPRSVVISSMQHDLAHEVVEEKCHAVNADLLCFGADFMVEANSDGMTFQSQDNAFIGLPAQYMQFSEPALFGHHQYVNAASAIAAAFVLGVSTNSMEIGLKAAKIPSRMERVEKPFIPQDWEFWLDGGHNSGAAYALANMILDKWTDRKPTYLIFGTTRGRNVADFLGKFAGIVEHIALVKVNSEPNSYDVEEILEQLGASTGQSLSTHSSIQEAVKFLHDKNPEPARVLCSGSLFMRGDVY